MVLCLFFPPPTEMFCCRNQLHLIARASGGSVITFLALNVSLYLNLRTMPNICSLNVELPLNKNVCTPWLVWLSLSERHPIHGEVWGFILGKGTYLGGGLDPWPGCIWEAPSRCLSLTSMCLSLSLFLSLKSDEKISSGKDKKMYCGH